MEFITTYIAYKNRPIPPHNSIFFRIYNNVGETVETMYVVINPKKYGIVRLYWVVFIGN
jgi:hypothetical protein